MFVMLCSLCHVYKWANAMLCHWYHVAKGNKHHVVMLVTYGYKRANDMLCVVGAMWLQKSQSYIVCCWCHVATKEPMSCCVLLVSCGYKRTNGMLCVVGAMWLQKSQWYVVCCWCHVATKEPMICCVLLVSCMLCCWCHVATKEPMICCVLLVSCGYKTHNVICTLANNNCNVHATIKLSLNEYHYN